MKKISLGSLFTCLLTIVMAQAPLTPETLWKLGRVSAIGLSKDKANLVYKVSTPDVQQNKSNSKTYMISLMGGAPVEVSNIDSIVGNNRISPDGKYILSSAEVKIQKVFGKDYYPDLQKSDVQIYNSLNYRHWDEWEDGSFSHVFYKELDSDKAGEGKDIMAGQPFDCPQKPFGGTEDFIWGPEGKSIIYVTKKKAGTAYALSTNTDIFRYDMETGLTTNLSEGMMGYDIAPSFSSTGTLAWLSMRRDGYEADKQDIVIRTPVGIVNLTKDWDGTVDSYIWSNDGSKIYFQAPVDGTRQLFELILPASKRGKPLIKQITNGLFDINGIVGHVNNSVIVSRTDMNHAAELYSVDLYDGNMAQLTHVNDEMYKNIAMSKVEKRYVTTTDNKKMLVYVIYPPGFDPTKKYPTLLYCQGGPQSPLTQSYSFRWNFQLMAANGYIVVAPNRRGMQGHGVEWNEQISKDWGGQVMDDYLSAIDDVSKEPYVDVTRRAAVGASYGGYSVFYLAGIHNNRFKTFIAHAGIFDTYSMYGTTEEMFFENWEKGGAYWEKENAIAQKSFSKFNPREMVEKWNAPIFIIHGGKDFRVPYTQGMQAFQAAQLRNINSKFMYFPEENHWILKPQNALVWQREFYKWLQETL